MSRRLALRRARRRAALDAVILADLAGHGQSSGYDVSKRLGIRSGRVYPSLHRLLDAGRVVDEWVPSANPRRPARRMYQVAPVAPVALTDEQAWRLRWLLQPAPLDRGRIIDTGGGA